MNRGERAARDFETSECENLRSSSVARSKLAFDHIDRAPPSHYCAHRRAATPTCTRKTTTTTAAAVNPVHLWWSVYLWFRPGNMAVPHSNISPIQRIPPELLQEIFSLAISRKPSGIATSGPEPLLLVCRRFFKAAMLFPGLWSSIVIDHDRKAQQGRTRPTLLAKTLAYLERSRCYPLSIYLGLAADATMDAMDDFYDCGTAIIGDRGRHMARWRSLEMYLDNAWVEHVLNDFGWPTPTLSNITILKLPSFSQELRIDLTFAFADAKIETLDISLSNDCQFSEAFSSSIRVLTILESNDHWSMFALSRFCNLHGLTLGRFIDPEFKINPREWPEVVLPRLVVLDIRTPGWSGVLSHAQLPSLRLLILAADPSFSQWDENTTATLLCDLTRHTEYIRALFLTGLESPEVEEWQCFFSSLPSLAFCRMEECEIDFVSLLSRDWLCPILYRFEVDDEIWERPMAVEAWNSTRDACLKDVDGIRPLMRDLGFLVSHFH